MEKNDIKLKFKEKFSKYSGSLLEICCDIYEGLQANKEEDRVELFTYACKHFGITASDGSFSPSGRRISQNELNGLKEDCGPTVDILLEAILQKAIKEKMSEGSFYENAWNLIIQNPIFDTELKKIFALYFMLIDARIPYYPIDFGVEMNNSEFRNLNEECKDAIQKAKFVLAVDFPQKTMEASNLLDIILSQKDYKKQVIILARIILELRNGRDGLIDSLIDKMKDDE